MKRLMAGGPGRDRTGARASVVAIVVLALGFAVPISSAPAAQAAQVIHVPADQPTIQAAINAASSGDTIEVAAGTYTENIDFMGKSVELWAPSGAGNTVIDGSGATDGPVVQFSGGETSAAVVRGFTIASGPGSGVSVYGSSPTIVDNVIEGNASSGVYTSSASPLVQGNTIRDNGGLTGAGGGLQVIGWGAATVLGNEIIGNRAAFGGGIELFGSGPARVEGNLIQGNTAESYGGGVSVVNNSPALITQNLIIDNTAGGWRGGGGVFWSIPGGAGGGDLLRLVNNTVARNLAARGSALLADGNDDEAPLVINNVFSAASGSAVECADPASAPTPPTFRNNLAYAATGSAWSACDPTGADGNLTADPGFVDPIGTPGDFRVSPGSPAVDAGSNSAPGVPALDLEGHQRIADGNGDAQALIDLGAYELNAPGAPTIGAAVVGDRQATVSWMAPVSDGGAAITGYWVTAYEGYFPVKLVKFDSTSTSQVITGLTNGTTYWFRVRAVNAEGRSAFSHGTNLVTPVAPMVPGAPTIAAAVVGDGQVTVSWTAPASNGGSPITGYWVTAYEGYFPVKLVKFDSPVTSQVISGLANGTTYWFRVRAVNGVGRSAFSNGTNLVTPTA